MLKSQNLQHHYEYILNDVSIKEERLVALNNITITIFYDNKIEKLNIKKDDSLRLDKNRIYSHESNKGKYVDSYKDTIKNNFIKITCNKDMLSFEKYDNLKKSIMEGEEEKWNTIFNF